MKLDDIRVSIDSYFDSISEEELLEILTTKYNMQVIHNIEMNPMHISTNTNNNYISANIINYSFSVMDINIEDIDTYNDDESHVSDNYLDVA